MIKRLFKSRAFEDKTLWLSPVLWVGALALFKFALQANSIASIIVSYFAFRALIHFIFCETPGKFTLKNPHWKEQLIFSFILIGLYYCLFGALNNLPLLNASALFLSYPIFIPFIVRLWLGKKYDMRIFWTAPLILIGALLSLSYKFSWGIMGIALAIFAALLQATYWIGKRKLHTELFGRTFWFYESIFVLPTVSITLIDSFKPFNISVLFFVFLGVILEFLSTRFLKLSSSPPSHKSLIFNGSIFLCLIVDPLFFHTFTPIRPFFCAILIYLALFLTFFQKNILPNPSYDL